MEKTTCLFMSSKAECTGRRRKHLSMLICEKHLAEHYGLEMGFIKGDHGTIISYTGGYLKPIEGVVFKRNTVIIPTKDFFDRYFRPEDVNENTTAVSNAEILKYQMNPVIHDTVRHYSLSASTSVDKRLVIETYRNFTTELVDAGPKLEEHLRHLTTHVLSKRTISESLIKTQAISGHLNETNLFIGDTMKKIGDLKISTQLKYFMYNCLFSEMQLRSEGSSYFSDHLMFNVKYVENIGLVATEQIGDPMFLIIDGLLKGSQVYYNAFVTLIKKEISQKKITLKDVPQPFALSNSFRHGASC